VSPPPYFNDHSKVREVAFWAAATQTQIERWEPRFARRVAADTWKAAPPIPKGDIWQEIADRHFVLVAAAQLLSAMKFASFPVRAPEPLATEIRAGRDLAEHWQDNMPIFNVHPRSETPKYPSGREFAALNPRDGPYGFWWNSKVGPKLLPNVPAADLHVLIDRVKARVSADHPTLAEFFHEWALSPWFGGDDPNDRWFPALHIYDRGLGQVERERPTPQPPQI
jgi:hypothetical protein